MPLADTRAAAAAYITLRTTAPALVLEALVDADGPVVTGGYGGWSRVTRPRRQGLTVFDGRESFTMTVPLIFDQFRSGTSLETKLTALERMAMPPGDYRDPPVVRISGKTVPHSDLQWVIQDIEWRGVERNPAGERIRQYVTVTLFRYVAVDTVQLTSAGAAARGGLGAGVTGTRLYTVKENETLQGIAKRELKNAARWKEIANLNDIRDPKNLKKFWHKQIRIPLK
jgi:LysM repeat protein